MKVEIRYCNECKRRTIQAEDIYLDQHFVPTNIVPVWYCPICGIQWKPTKKTEDIKVG